MCVKCSPINYDLRDSELLAKGAALAGVKPYAAMTYAAVRAYREILHADPVSIIQQSSLMSRHYASDNLKGMHIHLASVCMLNLHSSLGYQ